LRDRLRATDPETWDLVVVGAGITGAGVARDAALRGLKVLVVEAHDLAWGTSSRSSRLIHGGVRYLEQAEIGLVFEALRERGRLYQSAPHLVRRARFLFPTYRGDRLGPWKLRLGLTLYDLLNLLRGEGHRFVSPAETRELVPLLAEQGLRGAVEYEDAVTDDARLTLTTLQDARRHGACVLTYAPVRAVVRDGNLHTVELEDGTEIPTRATVVATGPWTGPRLMGQAGERLLALSKGIHIVMRIEHIAVRQPVVVQAQEQRRILFVVPWGERTYLGTTDTAYEGDPGESGVTIADEAELLGLVGRIFTGAALRPEHIVSAWSGVRPLVRPPGAADDTVELSRSHRIVENDIGVLAIVGGKLTTFRAMAEEVVDAAVKKIRAHAPELDIGPCRTTQLPLVPGTAVSDAELGSDLLRDLEPRHGPLARALAERAAETPDLGARVIEDLPYRWVEVAHAVDHEACMHLDDILRRRLPLALKDPRLGAGVAREVAMRLVDARGGDEHDVQEELERYREVIGHETRRVPQLDQK
jgi:glycerol-3-phosphate dehydrogenase